MTDREKSAPRAVISLMEHESDTEARRASALNIFALVVAGALMLAPIAVAFG